MIEGRRSLLTKDIAQGPCSFWARRKTRLGLTGAHHVCPGWHIGQFGWGNGTRLMRWMNVRASPHR